MDQGNNEIPHWSPYHSGFSFYDVNCFIFFSVSLLVICTKLSLYSDDTKFERSSNTLRKTAEHQISEQLPLSHSKTKVNIKKF